MKGALSPTTAASTSPFPPAPRVFAQSTPHSLGRRTDTKRSLGGLSVVAYWAKKVLYSSSGQVVVVSSKSSQLCSVVRLEKLR